MKLNFNKFIVLSLLIVGVLITFLPFFYMIVCSFKTNAEIYTLPISFIPKRFYLENYRRLFREIPFAKQYFNSTFIASVQTILNVFLASLAGFGFAKYNFRLKNFLFIFLLVTMMIPGQVSLVPLFLMMHWFKWIDTYWAIIVPGAVSAFGIFFMRSSMMSIPDEILDSARIDGASEFGIYTRIILPMSTASIGILAILTFTGSWNNFMWPLIVLSSDTKMTLPVGLATLMNLYKIEYGMLMAGSFLSTIPILILLILVGQKAFIRGITIGALKG